MKTTIEIADDLFERVRRVARERKTTVRALTEQGLRLVLQAKVKASKLRAWKPVIMDGTGPTDEFKDWNWEKLRDEIYRGL
ncbi:MAG: DUF2191 domain-containing protein [Planctomycetes bacterium]|nr:DUF2191 domain-containing protein [Planctomycetota bacterium]